MTKKIKELEAELAAAMTERQKIDSLNTLAWELRDLDAKRGLGLAQTAYDLAKTEHYPKGLADSLSNQSHCNNWLSNFVIALSQGLEALALFEQLEDRSCQADVLCALSRAQMNLANYPDAVEWGWRAQTLAHEIGERLTEADALNNLGITYKRTGNYSQAFAAYANGLVLYRALGNKQREGKILNNIGIAYSAQKQYDQALTSALESLQLLQEIDSRPHEGYTLHAVGQIYAEMGSFDLALYYLQKTLPIASEIGHHYLYVVSLLSMGQVYAQLHQLDVAVSHLEQALTLAKEMDSKMYIFRCHGALAEIYESQGDLSQALAHYKQFYIVKEVVFSEESVNRLQSLEIRHQVESARKEAEIYHLRNVELEREINERKRLQEELHQQATTDVLTGVSNRRHFLELAQSEIIRSVRFKHPLAIALIDLDHFKQINDTYGHAGGDQALRAITKIFQKNIRKIDVFARFGGDEFVLLLPETNREEAYETLERVRLLLPAQPIDLNGAQVVLTLSSGLSLLASDQETFDTLLGRADQALYRAKEAGRNRVAIQDEANNE